MDLQIADPNALFDMVIGEHDEEGTINAEQLVRGVSRLKGAARSTDMHTLSAEVKKLQQRLQGQNPRFSGSNLSALRASVHSANSATPSMGVIGTFPPAILAKTSQQVQLAPQEI